jgi:hypothetical protein
MLFFVLEIFAKIEQLSLILNWAEFPYTDYFVLTFCGVLKPLLALVH